MTNIQKAVGKSNESANQLNEVKLITEPNEQQSAIHVITNTRQNQDNDITATSQESLPRNTQVPSNESVDLLIVGNSHVSRVNASRLFRTRTTKVVSLPEKSIQGAIDYIRHTKLKPKVCIFQISSNSIVNDTVSNCLLATTAFFNLSAKSMPSTLLFLADPLSRRLHSPQQREAYTFPAHVRLSAVDDARFSGDISIGRGWRHTQIKPGRT